MEKRAPSRKENKSQSVAKHLVIRFSDTLSGIVTVAEHQRVIAERKAVWMAKFGRPLSRSKMEVLAYQIGAGVPTHVFLVTRRQGKYAWYRGTLSDIASKPPDRERGLVPEYYKRQDVAPSASGASLWLKLGELRPASADEIRSLHVTSSGRHICDTLNASIAGMFVVQEGIPARTTVRRRDTQSRGGNLERDVLIAFEEDD